MAKSKPNVPKLTWAVGANGEIRHVSEVENGLKCVCVCPTCNRALVAKQGAVREHHFAHASGDECEHAVETALHLAAKEILAARKEMVLPAVEFDFPYTSRRTTIAPEQRFLIDSVVVEEKLGSIIPDLIVEKNGRELLVEVTVTHGVDGNKLRKIRDLGVSCVEIDLRRTARSLTREELEKIIVDDPTCKQWVHNVRAEEERRKILSEATLLTSTHRGFALHVDGCPIPARKWRGKAYANVMDDCTGCEHMLTLSGDVGVMCDGFRALGKPEPPESMGLRLPPEAFGHWEEGDPLGAARRWLDKHIDGAQLR